MFHFDPIVLLTLSFSSLFHMVRVERNRFLMSYMVIFLPMSFTWKKLLPLLMLVFPRLISLFRLIHTFMVVSKATNLFVVVVNVFMVITIQPHLLPTPLSLLGLFVKSFSRWITLHPNVGTTLIKNITPSTR